MGPRPIGHELDRINNNGNYEPGNCQWATRSQQVRNRSNAIRITWNGVTRTLPDWADYLGWSYDMLKARYQRGWAPGQMFTQPHGDPSHERRSKAALRMWQRRKAMAS
jgi:hypothetical protein